MLKAIFIFCVVIYLIIDILNIVFYVLAVIQCNNRLKTGCPDLYKFTNEHKAEIKKLDEKSIVSKIATFIRNCIIVFFPFFHLIVFSLFVIEWNEMVSEQYYKLVNHLDKCRKTIEKQKEKES